MVTIGLPLESVVALLLPQAANEPSIANALIAAPTLTAVFLLSISPVLSLVLSDKERQLPFHGIPFNAIAYRVATSPPRNRNDSIIYQNSL
ncbi:hypothetical protein PMO92_04890 [Bifidobacterium longum]|nr:hypothetical protein [Bifidobacterium longum]